MTESIQRLYWTLLYIHIKTDDPTNVEACSFGKPFVPDNCLFEIFGRSTVGGVVIVSKTRLVFGGYNFCLACLLILSEPQF